MFCLRLSIYIYVYIYKHLMSLILKYYFTSKIMNLLTLTPVILTSKSDVNMA